MGYLRTFTKMLMAVYKSVWVDNNTNYELGILDVLSLVFIEIFNTLIICAQWRSGL